MVQHFAMAQILHASDGVIDSLSNILKNKKEKEEKEEEEIK